MANCGRDGLKRDPYCVRGGNWEAGRGAPSRALGEARGEDWEARLQPLMKLVGTQTGRAAEREAGAESCWLVRGLGELPTSISICRWSC